jgi:hypothetical protein
VDNGRLDMTLLQVPQELADLLVSEGLAEAPSGRRSTTWEILATFAGGAATTIGLLQGPQTVGDLARMCLSLARRHSARPVPQPEPGYLVAIGERGQIRMPIAPDTTVEQVEHLLRNTIFKD